MAMIEIYPENKIQPLSQTELAGTLQRVGELDPDLLVFPDTRQLVNLGAQFMSEATQLYGTPAAPNLCSGTMHSEVFMSFHNGGEDGHTSIGQHGAGVPKNVLRITNAINEAAGMEVCGPLLRAQAFYAATAHDRYQLCGRVLLSDTAEGVGDERLSAEAATTRYLEVGGSETSAAEIYGNVMATAYNPDTVSQNVNYEQWQAYPDDPLVIHRVLGQEVVAAADLLSPTTKRGPLGALEFSIEMLTQQDRTVHERLLEQEGHISEVGNQALFDLIDTDKAVRDRFAELVAAQPMFFAKGLVYSDKVIQRVCGKGIDDLFPGRSRSTRVLQSYSDMFQQGASVNSLWRRARLHAGYQDSTQIL